MYSSEILIFLSEIWTRCYYFVFKSKTTVSLWFATVQFGYVNCTLVFIAITVSVKKSMIFPNKGNCTVSFWNSHAMLKCHQSRILVVMKQFQLLARGRQSQLVDFSISLLTPHMIFNEFQAFLRDYQHSTQVVYSLRVGHILHRRLSL